MPLQPAFYVTTFSRSSWKSQPPPAVHGRSNRVETPNLHPVLLLTDPRQLLHGPLPLHPGPDKEQQVNRSEVTILSLPLAIIEAVSQLVLQEEREEGDRVPCQSVSVGKSSLL